MERGVGQTEVVLDVGPNQTVCRSGHHERGRCQRTEPVGDIERGHRLPRTFVVSPGDRQRPVHAFLGLHLVVDFRASRTDHPLPHQFLGVSVVPKFGRRLAHRGRGARSTRRNRGHQNEAVQAVGVLEPQPHTDAAAHAVTHIGERTDAEGIGHTDHVGRVLGDRVPVFGVGAVTRSTRVHHHAPVPVLQMGDDRRPTVVASGIPVMEENDLARPTRVLVEQLDTVHQLMRHHGPSFVSAQGSTSGWLRHLRVPHQLRSEEFCRGVRRRPARCGDRVPVLRPR